MINTDSPKGAVTKTCDGGTSNLKTSCHEAIVINTDSPKDATPKTSNSGGGGHQHSNSILKWLVFDTLLFFHEKIIIKFNKRLPLRDLNPKVVL